MASNEQELMFGDFADLSPEDYQRILHILHGQRHQSSAKVEFPWTSGGDEMVGAVGGGTFTSHSWVDSVPDYANSQETNFHSNSFIGDSNYTVQFGFGANDPHLSELPGYGQGMDQEQMSAEANAQSKLQASLKTYERRNKKRRPPDYYKKQFGDHNSQRMNNQSANYCHDREQDMRTHGNYRPEMHMQMLPGHNQSGTGFIGYQENNVDVPHRGQQTPDCHTVYSNSDYSSHDAPPHAHNAITNNSESELMRRGDGELCEVVVESVSQKSIDVQARPETYQIQDHDRTKVESQNLAATVNVHDAMQHHPGNDSVKFTNLQMHSNIFPNSVPIISETNQDSVTLAQHHHRVDVSVRDAPVVDYSSQGHVTNLPFKATAQTKLSEPLENAPDELLQGKSCDAVPHFNTNETENKNNANNTTGVVNSAMDTDEGPVSMTTPQDTVTAPSTQEVMKPKPSSWAGLFKASSAPVGGVQVPSVKTDNSVDNSECARSEKEFSPLPVPATEDSVAKQLGEMLSQMSISHTSVALQPRGLVNKGNWCYINGTLQALVACPPFYNLLKKLPKYPALSRGPSSTPILDALVEFVHEFQPMARPTERGPKNRVARDITPGAPFEPSYVYKMLQTIAVNPHFKLGKQEDAEEFLSCILDGVHEEMSAAVGLTDKHASTDGGEEESYTNGFMTHTDGENEDEEVESQEEDSWEQVGPKKKSVLTRRSNFAKTPIADIFAGMIRSAVHKASAKETATLEPFFTLQLDIQSEKVWSVREALEGLVSKEPVSGYTCSKTNTEVEVTKKLSLEELPPVLIMHLKFFVYKDGAGSQKLMKKVDFPVELEITKDLLSPNARNKLSFQQRSYKLFAVVYHHGKTLTGGHYTTSVFHPGINGWVYSDDSTVKTTSVNQVLKYISPRVPYLLYYRRLDSH